MTPMQRLAWLFPEIDQFKVASNRADRGPYGRSLWLGISQSILNLPRFAWSVFWPTLRLTALALVKIVAMWATALLVVVVMPATLAYGGLAGMLRDCDPNETQESPGPKLT